MRYTVIIFLFLTVLVSRAFSFPDEHDTICVQDSSLMKRDTCVRDSDCGLHTRCDNNTCAQASLSTKPKELACPSGTLCRECTLCQRWFCADNKPISKNCSDDPVPKSCDYYACVEAAIPCGPKGYAIGYGQYYCEKFAKHEAEFSPQGQKWMYDVMQCLQMKLVPVVNKTMKLNCKELKDYAYDTHPVCYTSKVDSICNLPPKDWRVLVSIIEFKTLVDIDTIVQMFDVASTCGETYVDAVMKAIRDLLMKAVLKTHKYLVKENLEALKDGRPKLVEVIDEAWETLKSAWPSHVL